MWYVEVLVDEFGCVVVGWKPVLMSEGLGEERDMSGKDVENAYSIQRLGVSSEKVGLVPVAMLRSIVSSASSWYVAGRQKSVETISPSPIHARVTIQTTSATTKGTQDLSTVGSLLSLASTRSNATGENKRRMPLLSAGP